MQRSFTYASAVVAAVCTFVAPALGQEQIRSEKVGLTLTVPNGWRVTEAPQGLNLDYPVAVTTPYQGFTPNIVITDEVFSGTSDEYAADMTRSYGNMFSPSKLISKARFKTARGLLGTKVVSRNKLLGAVMRQVAYLFPSRTGVMMIFTVTSPVEQGFKHDKAMDDSMRNIVLDK